MTSKYIIHELNKYTYINIFLVDSFEKQIKSLLHLGFIDINIIDIALIYIKKLSVKKNIKHKNGLFLFWIALILADKFYHDDALTNIDWEKLIDIKCDRILLYELKFLKCIDYNLNINNKLFKNN